MNCSISRLTSIYNSNSLILLLIISFLCHPSRIGRWTLERSFDPFVDFLERLPQGRMSDLYSRVVNGRLPDMGLDGPRHGDRMAKPHTIITYWSTTSVHCTLRNWYAFPESSLRSLHRTSWYVHSLLHPTQSVITASFNVSNCSSHALSTSVPDLH